MPLLKRGEAAPQGVAVTEIKPVPIKAEAPKHEAGDRMSKADWAAKDTRISRQGLFQAALQSPALIQYAPTLEAYIELVVRTANAGLAYVNGDE